MIGISSLAIQFEVASLMVPSSAEHCQFTRGRLASLFKPSIAQDLNNFASSPADLSEPQMRKFKRITLMPQFIDTALEKSLNYTASVDSSKTLNLPWNEWRRRRSTSRGTSGLAYEFYKLDHQNQTEKENIPTGKFIPPQIITRSRMQSLHSRKSFPVTNLHQQFVTKEKLPRESSLGNNIDKLPNTKEISKCKFLSPMFRGIANAIGSKKNTGGGKARRLSLVTKNPSDFGDYRQPGPVFGAALEDQLSSPDFPNVPLVLQAAIAALESRGLHFIGLYRAPGRQSEINRFVCVSNLSVLNPHFMLSLPTWNDIKALTGVIKVFLRRLPEPICDPESWALLADTLPDETERMSKSSLFATLKGIRLNLVKDRSIASKKWQWRFATLDFLFNHLRRVIALEKANNCNFKCIAICFGPSLFNADSRSQAKFNVLVELMLQHWPWLRAEVSEEFPSSSQPIGAYIEDFFENGPDLSEDFKAFGSLKVAGSAKEVLDIVKRILNSVRRREIGQ
nr:hypothetical protein HmN_000473200 [Hymenolepis microstoma]